MFFSGCLFQIENFRSRMGLFSGRDVCAHHVFIQLDGLEIIEVYQIDDLNKFDLASVRQIFPREGRPSCWFCIVIPTLHHGGKADPDMFLFLFRWHYSNLAFALMAHVLADHAAEGQYQRWISENILDRLGMEDTGFDITPPIRSQMADLGWYRPSGQMYSTAADLAKLAMVFLGTYHRRLLAPDTVKTMLTPLFKCSMEYFANKTGTPWEINEQLGYDVIRKDGDLHGYSATLSLNPKLHLSFFVLMAGPRPQGGDTVAQTYEYLIPAMEMAFREAEKSLIPPPSPGPYVGYYTYSNLTFYEIKAGPAGVLVMQQFGPHVEELIPEKYRTIKLHHLEDRVCQVVFGKEFPCVLHLGSASKSLETQNEQLFNFRPFDRKGLSPGFDAPGLNTSSVVRVLRKPVFYS
uniref:Beta-lactamase-related domain-containing protein n=1 Tax=Amazona collaria TaxID=241587 RepID=A0A8B9G9B2_9PSIT